MSALDLLLEPFQLDSRSFVAGSLWGTLVMLMTYTACIIFYSLKTGE